jgi:hypothetical protein
MNAGDLEVPLFGCKHARPRLITLRNVALIILIWWTAFAYAAEKSTLIVHTDGSYSLYLVPIAQTEAVEACRRGGPVRVMDNENYLETSDFLPALQLVRICFVDSDRKSLFLSPVITAPLSDDVAVVLIARNQQVSVLQVRKPEDPYAGIWPAELDDCHFTGRGWKPRCFMGLHAAGLAARQVCSADSYFPDDQQRRLCFSIFASWTNECCRVAAAIRTITRRERHHHWSKRPSNRGLL